MGLAKAVAARFPDWGPEFVTLIVRPCQGPGLPSGSNWPAASLPFYSGSNVVDTPLYARLCYKPLTLNICTHYSNGRCSSAPGV